MSEETTPKKHWSSYSGLTKHRSCPQAWTYSSIRSLEPLPGEDAAVEAWFGTWWHALRAAYDIQRGNRLGTLGLAPASLTVVPLPSEKPYYENMKPDQVPITITPGGVIDLADLWWSTLSEETKEVWLKTLGEEPAERLLYVDEEWREQWAEENESEQPLAVEMRWSRALPAVTQPGGDKRDPGTNLVGYIDEVYYDRKRALVVARDRKTSKSLDPQTALDDMLDSQLMLYAWGGAPMISSLGRGQVKAIGYDRVRMVKPKTPVLTKSGKLSATTSDWDARTYREWTAEGQAFEGLKKDGSGAGVYELEESVLAHYSSPAIRAKWFARTLTPVNRNALVAHLRAATDTAIDQQLTRDRFEVEGMAARNLTRACKWCDFVGLCRIEMMGGVEGDYDLAEFGLRKKPGKSR